MSYRKLLCGASVIVFAISLVPYQAKAATSALAIPDSALNAIVGQTVSEEFRASSTGLTVTGSTNLSGTVGGSFSASFSVSGGTAPYQWRQTGGVLPDGINSAFPVFNCITTPCIHPYDTVLFKGVPTQASSASATFRVTDATGYAKEFTFTITVTAANTRALRTGYVDVVTSQRIEGWAFDSAVSGACVTITYKRNALASDNAQYTQDVCPTVARADAAEWIGKNFGGGYVVVQPLGFRADPAQVLSPGVYSVAGVKLKDSGVALGLGEAAKLSFTIVDTALPFGPIVISSPAKGIVLQAGQAMNIAWTGSNNLPVTLKLVERRECELVGVCPAVLPRQYVIVENYTGSGYMWTIPFTVAPANYQVHIETAVAGVDYVLWGRSGVFSIQVPRTGALQVSSPVAGEQVYAGYVKTITWNVLADAQNVPVSISYTYINHPACLDAPTPCALPETLVTVPIATAAPNTGSYDWLVPASLNGKYTLVVSMGSYFAESGQFSVVSRTNSENIVVKAPIKDEVWSRGETHVIYWSPNVANTKVSISVTRYIACLHNETYVCALAHPVPVVIEPSAPDTGSYEWVIPKDFALSGPVTIAIANTTTGKTGESAPFYMSDGTALMPCATIKPGQVVAATRGTVYVITSDCKKYGFTSLQDFTSRGYSLSQVQKVDQAALDAIPATEFLARSANTSFRYSGQRVVYYLNAANCKEAYPSLVTLRAWGIVTSSIVVLPNGEQYPDCSPSFVRLPNNTWAQVIGQPTVYHVEGTVMRPYTTLGALIASGFQRGKLYVIRPAEFSLYTVGDPIQ